MLCRFAVCPTRTSPVSVKATIDGVVRAPSAFSMTFALLPSITATHELVVPRSMPIALAMMALLYRQMFPCTDGRLPPIVPNRNCVGRAEIIWGRAPSGEDAGARPHWPQDQAASLTSIFLAADRAGLGIVILSTPLDIVAWTDDGSTPGGSCRTR